MPGWSVLPIITGNGWTVLADPSFQLKSRDRLRMANRETLGGVIHTYQRYDPAKFPSPTQPPPDLVSHAMEHMLMFGEHRELTEEELARAIRIDPSQIAGLGPSIDALIAMLEERKRKILAKYETKTVLQRAQEAFVDQATETKVPKPFRQAFYKA